MSEWDVVPESVPAGVCETPLRAAPRASGIRATVIDEDEIDTTSPVDDGVGVSEEEVVEEVEEVKDVEGMLLSSSPPRSEEEAVTSLPDDKKKEEDGTEVQEEKEVDDGGESSDDEYYGEVFGDELGKKKPKKKLTEEDSAWWKSRKKHIFLFSPAGKPIFSRYGDESRLCGFIGVLQALFSFVADTASDTLRTIKAGAHFVVFRRVAPLFLVAVAATGESPAVLRSQLGVLALQVLSLLTASISRTLERDPAFDLRRLIGTSGDTALRRLITRASTCPAYGLGAVEAVPVPSSAQKGTRQRIGDVLREEGAAAGTRHLLFVFVLLGDRLVHLARHKGFLLHPHDVLLCANTLAAHPSMRTADTWAPLCFPMFNERGFLYCHVSYLDNTWALVLASSRTDDFPLLQVAKERIVPRLLPLLRRLDVQPGQQSTGYTVADVGVPGLLHFVYNGEGVVQYSEPASGPPFHTRASRKRLVRWYLNTMEDMVRSKAQVRFERRLDAAVYSVHSKFFWLFVCVDAMATKQTAAAASQAVQRFLKSNENNLFIMDIAQWE